MENLLKVRQHKIMPIYPFEIIEYILISQKNESTLLKPNENKKMDYLFIDCRIEPKVQTLPKSLHIPKKIEKKKVSFSRMIL